MPSYEYRCPDCAYFVLQRSMRDDSSGSLPCPTCGTPSARVFRAPGVSRTSAGLSRVLGRAEASADTPAVVRRPPVTAVRQRPASPYPPLPRP